VLLTRPSSPSACARPVRRAWTIWKPYRRSTGNLRCWRPPPGVRFVVIAADRGRDGERSALMLAAALRALDVHGAIRWPPAPFGDWNEARLAKLEEEGGRGSAGAADGWSGPPARSSRHDP
jgi:putative DNA primase/helicase